MIVKRISNEEPVEFKPITVELVIESEDELLGLWHRLNIGMDNVKKHSNDCRKPFPKEDDNTLSFWTLLDNEYDRRKKREEAAD